MKVRTLAAALALCGTLFQQAMAEEKVSIPSFTPASRNDLLKHTGAAANVTGTLYLPAKAAGPVAAVILKHGSGGLEGPNGANIRKWAATLTGWGVAAFIVDSFGPRQIKETASNQGQLSAWADVADSFAALTVLAADVRIDKTRIGIMGWSRGGTPVMITAQEEARKASVAGDLKFAVHISVYGPAMTQYRGAATDRSPFLFLHGEADDYVAVGPTREYADWLKTMGNPVTFVGYPGAYHDFDVEGGFQGVAKAVETSKCDLVVNMADGKILRMGQKRPAQAPKAEELTAYLKTCAGHGAMLKLDAKARGAAVEQVHTFLKETLKAPG